MKIQCNACEAAEAAVLCCADEAALCLSCDEKVHKANKLAEKHQRVPLISAPSSNKLPKCDICQESPGYFFCLEDRALFCRNCDVSIHTANAYVSAHRRFLLTGVQVGLDQTEPPPSNAKERRLDRTRVVPEPPSKPLPIGSSSSSMYFSDGANQLFSNHMNNDGYYGTSKSSYTKVNLVGNLPDWSVDELFEFNDFNQNYNLNEHVSSKADSGKLGSSDGSPYFPVDERLEMDECIGQVPEISQIMMPKVPSPPTASGLHWQRNANCYGSDHAAFVPDITSSHDLYGYQINAKRRR